MVRDPETGDLFVFNHLEYDATTIGDEYHRDLLAGLNTALPKNYFPNDDPTLPPITTGGRLLFCLWLTGSMICISQHLLIERIAKK